MLVLFVLDRTMGWGKEWEIVTCQQMQDGIYYQRDDGAVVEVAGGIGLSADRAQRLLTGLVERGVLRARGTAGRARQLALNYEWTPDTDMKVSQRPKQLQRGLKVPKSTPVNITATPVNITPPPRYINGLRVAKQQDGNKRERTAARERGEGRLAEVADTAAQRTRDKHAAKLSRLANADTLSLASLSSVWGAACAAAHSGESLPDVRQKDFLILQACMRRHSAGEHSVRFVPLLQWSVAQWRSIVSAYFRWMPDAPVLPEPRFFVRFIDRFLNAHSRLEELERLQNMTTREQMVYHLTARKGMSQEAAEREVDEKLGLLRIKQDIEAERKKLQQLQSSSVEAVESKQRLALMQREAKQVEARAVTLTKGTFDTWE
jgi:hypothetical protein